VVSEPPDPPVEVFSISIGSTDIRPAVKLVRRGVMVIGGVGTPGGAGRVLDGDGFGDAVVGLGASLGAGGVVSGSAAGVSGGAVVGASLGAGGVGTSVGAASAGGLGFVVGGAGLPVSRAMAMATAAIPAAAPPAMAVLRGPTLV
jgi:hypothetical protein